MKNFLLATLLTAVVLVPGWAEKTQVGFDAVIETIQFKDVSEARQKLVLARLGVHVGDPLTSEARQQIGRALRQAQSSVVEQSLTFTYTPGSKGGTAKLIISAGC